MKTITAQFVATNCIEGALIRWKTDSEIEHVNLVTEDGFLQGALIDGGVEKRPTDYGPFTLQLRVTLSVTDAQYEAFWTFADSKVGEKYNVAGIAGIAFGDNLTNSDEMFCSQYASDCIAAAGIFRIDKATCKVDPELLRMMMMSQPGATEQRIQQATSAAESK